jgi:hypothetical protein
MVHQYSSDSPTTTLEHAYENLINKVPDVKQRNIIVNKAMGTDKLEATQEDIISLFNPHADYVRAYNERAIKEEKKALKNEERQLYNEAGQAYEHLWKNDTFKKIHDPLSNFV